MLLWSVGDVDKTLWSATFNGDISLCFGFNEGTRALLGSLIEAVSLYETAA